MYLVATFFHLILLDSGIGLISLCSLTSYSNAVAPHAGAWIETYLSNTCRAYATSRLTQARGLKHCVERIPICRRMSRLTQARGLKPFFNGTTNYAVGVAPHAGAWIETTNKP